MFSSLTKSSTRFLSQAAFMSSRLFSTTSAGVQTISQPKIGRDFKVSVFSAQPYDQRFFNIANAQHGFTLNYHTAALDITTTPACEGADAVCAFVNDSLDANVLEAIHKQGVKAIALRCAGFNQVDLEAAKRLGLEVTRVPAYAPEAVAEHAIALLMTLNRRTHKAFNRVREGNFALEGLLGANIHGKTAGVIGLGKIGLATAKILNGFGCRVLGFDPTSSAEFAKFGQEATLDEVLAQSDIITLHCPLLPQTHHLINAEAIAKMKKGVLLINTSRGGLVDTMAAIKGLKNKQIGGLGIDVYEQEGSLFFRDLSSDIIQDDVFERLMTFPNVLVTGHQGFFTQEALHEIANVTLSNLSCFVDGTACSNALVHRVPASVNVEQIKVEVVGK